MNKGLVQVYTGDGKGKTTAAFGQALRAAGRGLDVAVIQFLKEGDSGEVLYAQGNIPQISIYNFCTQKKFVWDMNDEEKDLLKKEIRNGLEQAGKLVREKECDMLILDEIIWAIKMEFISIKEIDTLLKDRPDEMEIILTGSGAGKEIIELADLVTEMKKIKHPFDKGIRARKGIER